MKKKYTIEGFYPFQLESEGVGAGLFGREDKQWDNAEVLFTLFVCDIQSNVVEKFELLMKEYEIWCDEFGAEYNYEEKDFLEYFNRGEPK